MNTDLHRFFTSAVSYVRSPKLTLDIGLWTYLLILCNLVVSAETPLDYFEEGNQYYKEGKFEQAISQWQKIIGEGIENHNVYFNLGNAYYKQGKLGMAIAYYTKAKLLDPTDKDIAANLEFVTQRTVDKITLPRKGPLLRILLYGFDWLSPNLLTIIFTIFYLGLLGGLSIWVVKKKPIITSIGLWLLIGLLVVDGGLLAAKLRQLKIARGVVSEPKVDILSGPGEDYTLISTLHEGTAFTIMSEEKGWIEIILSNGVKGWLKGEGTLRI